MADHEEYRIRRNRMETDPSYKNYREGYYRSPGGKVVKTVTSYEAEMVNLTEYGSSWSSSIYPVLWDLLMGEWTYLGDKLMKVIGKSNFDNEMVSDYLVRKNLSKEEAEALAQKLNDAVGDHSTYFYKAVENDHKLYEFEP